MNYIKQILLAIAIICCGTLYAQVDWVGNMFPNTVNTVEGETENIYVQVFEAGVTEPAGQGSGLICELYYGEVSSFGAAWMNISQLPMSYNTDIGNNDEYQLDVAAISAGLYEYTCRCSMDGGASWTFADLPSGNGQMTILAPAPVRLTEFNVTIDNNDILLNWATASEENASHFEVEKSLDGRSWKRIGQVDAFGFSATSRQYHFEDHRPTTGWQYYRLKQIDFDESYEYSASRSANFKSADQILIFPNPLHNGILKIEGAKEWTHFELFANDGKSVLAGRNTSQALALTALHRGIYFLQLKDEYGLVILTEKIEIL